MTLSYLTSEREYDVVVSDEEAEATGAGLYSNFCHLSFLSCPRSYYVMTLSFLTSEREYEVAVSDEEAGATGAGLSSYLCPFSVLGLFCTALSCTFTFPSVGSMTL